jgi:hypothetical protein
MIFALCTEIKLSNLTRQPWVWLENCPPFHRAKSFSTSYSQFAHNRSSGLPVEFLSGKEDKIAKIIKAN